MVDRETKTFSFSYYHDGSWWTFRIKAYDRDDATERINKLPLAQYDGEIVAKIPAFVPSWTIRVATWFQNLIPQRN